MLNITRNHYTLHPCKLLTVFQNQSMTPHHSEILVRKYWTRRFIWRHLLAKPSTWRHPSPSWCPSVGAWVTSDRDRCLPGETPDTHSTWPDKPFLAAKSGSASEPWLVQFSMFGRYLDKSDKSVKQTQTAISEGWLRKERKRCSALGSLDIEISILKD